MICQIETKGHNSTKISKIRITFTSYTHQNGQGMKALKTIVTIAMILGSLNASGTQIKTISSQDGISNNAILSMYQNSLGHLYIGTMDGLNIWNGHSMETFSASDGYNYFFGNQIKFIIPGKDETLYLQTTYGLAKVDMISRDVRFFRELAFCNHIAVNEKGNIFSIDSHNILLHLDTATSEVTEYPDLKISENATCYRLLISEDGKLCIFTSEDTYIITFSDETRPVIRKVENLNVKNLHVAAGFDDTRHFLITKDHRLCIFNTEDCRLENVKTILSDLPDRDLITGIIPDRDDEGCFISFMQNGVKYMPYDTGSLEPTDIQCGVFSMIPDRNQPIIWIGTDCNGLIRWSKTAIDMTCITYKQLPYSIEMPVRSVYLDRNNDLWFGTKGDGLYRMRNFSPKAEFSQSNVDKYTKESSPLTHNSVYSIVESRHDFFWIGSEGDGLNYYSYRTGQIGVVKGSERFSFVHSIIEQDDSTLWVATDGRGCYKCHFKVTGAEIPVITDIEEIRFIEPFRFNTSIFAMAEQNDSTIWFGSRGKGVLAYDINSGKSKIVQFPTDEGMAFNETFSIARSDEMLFATGNGLAIYSSEKDSVMIPDFLPRKATHTVLTDGNDNIWVTTNSGIISLDKDFNYRSSFDRSSGIEVLEYSDGAAYRDTLSRTIFFGGINGITIINEDSEIVDTTADSYTPDIHITDFIQNNESVHISLKMKKGRLRIPYSKSLFAIGFSVVDNLNYPDYEFSYIIEGYNREWTINQNNVIYIPSLNPGNYRLKIKYRNKATLHESEECCLPIYIIPPVYKRWWMVVIYFLLFLFIIFKITQYTKEKYASMKRKLKKQYDKEVSKVKAETTSLITEELSAQITFMLGLCQQIRQQNQSNQYLASKVNLMEYNIAKINRILQILNEYNGISDNKTNSEEVALIPVSQIANEMLEIIKSATSTRKVTIFHNIEDNIILSTGKEAFLTLFNSLIYKTISITEGKKEIHLGVSHRENGGGVSIRISASVSAATYKEIAATLDTYEIKSLLESDKNDDNISNFEFIMCSRLINEIGGRLEHTYDEEGQSLNIHIELPQHNIEEKQVRYEDSFISENISMFNTLVENEIPNSFTTNQHLKFIYLISSNKNISSFLGYLLSEKYNIMEYTDNVSTLTDMKEHMPIAVIYDVSSMMSSFAEFMERIKDNDRTEQIPVIALTSSLQITEREDCTKLGADLCISFPFNMDYLHSALEKMLNKRESIAEYYRSPISTYVMNEGKIIHRDDRNFMNSIFKTIEENISNPALSATMIAKQLNISTRVMYRKLGAITEKTLHQIIKELRMEMATKLLSSSKLTIDEIMYQVGHDNRSTFYRNFKEAMGMTPKEYRDSIKSHVMKSFTPPSS